MATTTAAKKNKKALTCFVITRSGPILRSIRIDHVEIPSHDGYVSIHLDHCPYIVRIGYGELKIYNEDNKLINMYVEDGVFVEELLYVETVYFGYDLRKLNSKFVFKDDKLVRREQCEDQLFRREQELQSVDSAGHGDGTHRQYDQYRKE